ncbi:hypothetical protein H0H81_002326 [Sphagnurus paluster]|uniref:LAA1-like C-terminal TPR repeats domain-containing protein n=1 Tax=Sphagnurus paluster TaxID=117069 RepID=A0A9P7KN10_9AGAR|nr:hypothetical protein H0H81_002326 [Sphagnurus paluster]
MLSLGETGELSPNASAMLRISTLSAWAQLQVETPNQNYLEDVVKPHRSTLASLWIAALRDYASIRVDSEFINDTSTVALDSSYSSLGKEVLLPYYAKSWPVILQAVATSMESGDPHILAAMDGQESSPDTKAPGTNREEPTAFFYIVFGLVYEALVTSSADPSASPAQQSLVVSALQALKCLVRPEYSGKAIKEPTIFEEFISLCYRIAMTEPANIQIHLVDMLSSFAIAQEHQSSSGDELSLTSPRAHCLRICAHILRSSTSSARGQSIQLLKDESSEIDLVGPTLPALKSMLDLPPATSTGSQDVYVRLVHGLLSSCLLHIDAMSGRDGLISAKKIKNNLLAAVLILTVLPSSVKVSKAVVEHACFLISQKLLESGELSLTAAHCAKTLIVASTAGNAMLHQSVRLLIPGLIEYIAKMAPLVQDGTISEPQVAAVGEVWKAFSAFFASTAEVHRVRLLGVLLPTIALLLSNSQTAPSPVTTQTIAQLLIYATSSPAAFKDAAAKLDNTTRELLEQSIRRAVAGTASTAAQSTAKPQISLRSF